MLEARTEAEAADVAVIGAGMAGLICAQTLHQSGIRARVFEKSRGLGGRLATRRRNGLQFDHGAQFVKAHSEQFLERLHAWRLSGTVADWAPRVVPDDFAQPHSETAWFVGHPGMSNLVKPSADGLAIETRTEISALSRDAGQITLLTRQGQQFGPFDTVVVAVPAPQAMALLSPLDEDFQVLSDVIFAPCWAGLFAFESPVSIASDIIRPSGSPIAWGARDCSKPDRPGEADTWVVHASPSWSREHLETGKEEMAPVLLAEFGKAVGCAGFPKLMHLEAHRWRYALVERPLGQACLVSQDGRLIAAGDWCIAPRVEAAFESGLAAAQTVLDMWASPAKAFGTES